MQNFARGGGVNTGPADADGSCRTKELFTVSLVEGSDACGVLELKADEIPITTQYNTLGVMHRADWIRRALRDAKAR